MPLQEVIAYSVTKALLDVQSKQGVPVVFGVLTVMNMGQAQERADSDLGWSWGQAALAQVATWSAVAKGFPNRGGRSWVGGLRLLRNSKWALMIAADVVEA